MFILLLTTCSLCSVNDLISPSKLLKSAKSSSSAEWEVLIPLFLARSDEDLDNVVSVRSCIYLPNTQSKYPQCFPDDRLRMRRFKESQFTNRTIFAAREDRFTPRLCLGSESQSCNLGKVSLAEYLVQMPSPGDAPYKVINAK